MDSGVIGWKRGGDAPVGSRQRDPLKSNKETYETEGIVKMEQVHRSVKRVFTFALVWSILAVVGIPMIVFGAIHLGDSGAAKAFAIAGFVLGLLFSGGGFYGVPLLWISYGSHRELARVVDAIDRLGLLTVDRLAAHLMMREKDVRTRIETCFTRGYLPGYVRQGDTLMRYTAVDPEEIEHTVECPSCAARFTYRGSRGKCPYCGNTYETR